MSEQLANSAVGKRHHPSWRLIIFTLAAFNLVAVVLALGLNHHLAGLYRDSVAMNKYWAGKLNKVAELEGLLSQANIDVNDVLANQLPEKQALLFEAKASVFHTIAHTLQADLKEDTDQAPIQIAKAIDLLDLSHGRVEAMQAAADDLFRIASEEGTQMAGPAMTVFEHHYAETNSHLASIRRRLSLIKDGYLNKQSETALFTWNTQIVGGIMSMMLVLCIAYYGYRLSITMRRMDDDRELALLELSNQKLAIDQHSIVSISDVRGNITYANDKLCELSGYTLEELLGNNHHMLKSDEHPKAFYRELWKTISGGNVWRGEIKNRAKDGSHYWVDATIIPFKDELGRITQYTAIRTDITALKEAEQRNRRQAARLETATQGAQVGIWELEIDTSRVLWDNAMHNLYGIRPEQCKPDGLYQLWRSAVHPDDVERVERELGRAIESDHPFDAVFRIIRPDNGQTRHIKTNATIERNDQGRAVSMIGVNWDVTDNMVASQEIEHREEEIRAILDAIPAFVYYKDANNTILRLNRAAADAIGKPVSEIENHKTEDFFSAKDAAHYLRDDREVISSRLPKLGIVESHNTSGNDPQIIRTDKIPLRNTEGVYDRLVAVATDITAVKKIEHDLQVSANRATLLNKIGEISEEASEFHVALQQAVDFTCEILGWKIGHCYLRDPQADDLLAPSDIWHIGIGKSQNLFRRVTEQAKFHPGVGLPGQVFATGQVVWVPDICNEINFPRNTPDIDLGIHGAVAFPVVVSGRIEAVLEFFSDQPMPEDPQMMVTFEAAARQLGIVLERHKAAESERVIAQRLDFALVAANQGLWDWNLADNSTYFNDTWYTMLGYEPAELPMNFDTWEQLGHPDDLPVAMACIQQHIKGETDIYRCEQRLRMKDGSWKWIMDVGKITEYDKQGNPLHMVGVHIDIDQIKANEHSLKQSERRFKLAVRGSRDGLWDWDLITDQVYYAPRWMQMLGLDEQHVSDSPDEWTSRIDQRDLGAFMQEFDQHLRGEDQVFEVELRMRHFDGHTVWMLCRGAVVRDKTGRAIRVAGSLADINEIKQVQHELRRMAEHDKLTSLPNRELFHSRLRDAIQHSRNDPNFKFAVLFFDFDRFKVVNDSLGHDVGDALLGNIADQFRHVLRTNDTAARFGGDEFVVLLNGLKTYDEALLAGNRLLDTFAKPHRLVGHDVFSTASIGLVTNESGYDNAEDMIRDADAAMYQAKEAGKARIIVFDQKMHADALDRLQLEADLRNALDNDEFHLVYQPIISLEAGELQGFEALLRWTHATRGNVSPADFIPIAEDTGLIVPIGEWVLRNACEQLYQWNHIDRPELPVTLNVNLSMRQVCHPNIIDMISTAVQDSGVDLQYLKLEVTESTMVDDRHDMIPRLNQLKDLGISLAMDDFGTGHSSLGNLHKLPVDVLKIDQSFIKSMSANRELAAVMHAIITLAHELGMQTVAEGIETPEQLVMLQSLDCNFGQGYYFKRPMLSDDATRYLMGLDDTAASA